MQTQTAKLLPSPGQRVECVNMREDSWPVLAGDKGTVLRVEQWGAGPNYANIHVAWDSGRTLALLTDVDEWKVLDDLAGGSN